MDFFVTIVIDSLGQGFFILLRRLITTILYKEIGHMDSNS